MDKHLEVSLASRCLKLGPQLTTCCATPQKLSKKHVGTLFLTAEVSNVPFLVSKMEVQVLPCVVGFVSGVSKMKSVIPASLLHSVADC